MNNKIYKQTTRILAVGVLAALYLMVQLPQLSDTETQALAQQFGFEVATIDLQETDYARIRKVHKSYESIAGWISAVGAAATITDLSGKGIYNDLLLTDPRTDKVHWLTEMENPNGSFDVTELPYDASTMAPMGTLSSDFDENGELDVLVYYWGRTPVIFYQNDGQFSQKELTTDYEKWFSNVGTLADVNGDGHVDILIGNYFPDYGAVLDSKNTEKQNMQHSMSKADNGALNRLFLADADAPNGFKEAKNWLDEIEIPYDWTLAIAAADLNGDLLPEIYIANDFGPDKLLLNRSTKTEIKFELVKGKRGFTTMASCVLGEDSFKGMGADIGDINGDGLLDIYVSNIAADYGLHESHFLFLQTGETDAWENGRAPFKNQSESMGVSRSSWSWDSKMADFNNDGRKEAIQATGFLKGEINRWPELHEVAMGNDELLSTTAVWHKLEAGDELCGDDHNPFFVQDAEGYFHDLAPALGLDQGQVTRGLAIADVDHDGDLDFVAANQWEASRLYKNTNNSNPHTGTFLGLNIQKTIQTKDNTIQLSAPAIGCQVKVLSIDSEPLNADRQLIDFVNGGNGHSGVNSHEVFFGLGVTPADATIAVELKWINFEGQAQQKVVQLSPGWHQIQL